MDIQSLLQALVPQRYSIPLGLDSLKPGDRLTGRIVEHRPDGQTLVDFGRFRALAQLKVPLPQDALVNLRVMETGSKVHMTLVSPGQGTQTALEVPLSRFEILTGDLFQQLQGDIRQLLDNLPRNPAQASESASAAPAAPSTPGAPAAPRLGGMALLPEALQKSLQQLQAHLRPINPQADVAQIVSQVRAAVAESGIYFEKRLEGVLRALQGRMPDASLEQLARQPEIRQIFQNDLKPNLLLLKDQLEALPRERNPEIEAALQRLKTTVDQMLTDIDHQQRQVLSRAFGPDPEQLFSHWLHLQDEAQLSRLKIYHRKNREADPDAAPRVTLLLDLDRLGEVRTDLFLSGAVLNLHFYVTREAVKASLDSHMGELTAKLEGGDGPVAVQVTVSPQKVAQLKSEPPLTAGGRGLVDLKA